MRQEQGDLDENRQLAFPELQAFGQQQLDLERRDYDFFDYARAYQGHHFESSTTPAAVIANTPLWLVRGRGVSYLLERGKRIEFVHVDLSHEARADINVTQCLERFTSAWLQRSAKSVLIAAARKSVVRAAARKKRCQSS